MKLVVGLGNPGPKYERTRHNIGFMAVDEIVRRHGFRPAREKFNGLITEGEIDGIRVAALKPMTFMNESGTSVAPAARFFKIAPADIIVIHDELDLAPGKLKVKRGGGSAGHNGLRSIDAHLDPDYWRLRLGIGHPGRKDLVLSWVLQNFAAEDHIWLDRQLPAVAEAIPLLIGGDDAGFMTKVALLLNPPAPRLPPLKPLGTKPATE
ncbi:MAG TPA: aminoacyl-tRNA hydrolase [Stellaceae bacterium]|nr:aminoacyl-tRNA hydrolase [Stellaceae bacterium]